MKDNLFPSDEELDKLLMEDQEVEVEEEEETEESITEDTSSTESESTEQDSDALRQQVEQLTKLVNDMKEGKTSSPSDEDVDSMLTELGELDEEDLEDLPPSVRAKLKSIDKLEKKYAKMEKERQEQKVQNRADGFVRDLDSLSKDYPALKDRNVRYATLMYAANGLGDTSKKGFLRAFQDLSKSFGTSAKADVAKKVKAAKKQKETAPKVGKGGMPSLTTDNTPKTLAEATEMAQAFLKKL